MKARPEYNDAVKELTLLAIAAIVVSIVVEVIILCCRNCARKVPANYFLLLIFTVCQSTFFSFVCSHYSTESCLTAAFMTAVITVGLTTYACITSTDFTMCRSFFLLMSLSSICFMIVSTYLAFSAWWHPFLCSVLVVVFGLYLVYDTQLIASGKSHSLSYDDYILAALLVYVDVLMLFLEFLKLFGSKRDQT